MQSYSTKGYGRPLGALRSRKSEEERMDRVGRRIGEGSQVLFFRGYRDSKIVSRRSDIYLLVYFRR